MSARDEQWGPWIFDLIDCNPISGSLVWLYRPRDHFKSGNDYSVWNSRYAHKPALNSLNAKGYMCGSLMGKGLLAHRAIWMAHSGRFQFGEIDHVNGEKSDNRIENLREVTRTENCRNAALNRNNTSGICGVNKSGRKWLARIGSGKERITLGSFRNIDDAIAARKEAERRLGYSVRHGLPAPQPEQVDA